MTLAYYHTTYWPIRQVASKFILLLPSLLSISTQMHIINAHKNKTCTHNGNFAQYAQSHKLLQYVHPEHLEWSHRLPLLVSELSSVDPCLGCLQEVDTEVWQELLNSLQKYKGVLQERKGSSDTAPMCAILYKPGTMGGGYIC